MQGDSRASVAAPAAMQDVVHIDEDRFACLQIADQMKPQHIEHATLRGDHILRPRRNASLPDHHRTDAMGIAEGHQAVAVDHGDHRIAAPAAAMHAAHRPEDGLGGERRAAGFVQFMGEDVEQDLGIRVGIDVAPIDLEEFPFQLMGIGQVAVVGQGDPVGRVDIEGLGFQGGMAAGRGVTHMADAHGADQPREVAGLKDIPHQAVFLMEKHLVQMTGGHAGGILAPVLENTQSFIKTR